MRERRVELVVEQRDGVGRALGRRAVGVEQRPHRGQQLARLGDQGLGHERLRNIGGRDRGLVGEV